MDHFTPQPHAVHPAHGIPVPHNRHLSVEEQEELQRWLASRGSDESLNVREIAAFVSRSQHMLDVIMKSVTSVSVGRHLTPPSMTHAVALLGTRHTIALLKKLAETSRRVNASRP